MMVVGMGVILVGAQMAKARQSATRQDSPYPQSPHPQSGWSPNQGGYASLPDIDSTPQGQSAQGVRSPQGSTSPLIPVGPPQQSTTFNEGSPSAFVSPPVPNAAHSGTDGALDTAVSCIGNIQPTHSHHSAAPISATTDLYIGGMARVISSYKRTAGRIGQVVSLGGHDVELKFKGTFGSLSFRRKHVVAVTSTSSP